MTSDYETTRQKERLEDQRKEKRQKTEMALLCAELDNILTHPDPYTPAPERQAEILDCLFYTVMRYHLQFAKEHRHFREDHLKIVLCIQKHAMDMSKAAAAINYMNGLAPNAYARMTPTPLAGPHTSALLDLAGTTLDSPPVLSDT